MTCLGTALNVPKLDGSTKPFASTRLFEITLIDYGCLYENVTCPWLHAQPILRKTDDGYRCRRW